MIKLKVRGLKWQKLKVKGPVLDFCCKKKKKKIHNCEPFPYKTINTIFFFFLRIWNFCTRIVPFFFNNFGLVFKKIIDAQKKKTKFGLGSKK